MPRAYTEDYAGWVEDTARAIEDGRFSEIDRTALADEVRDLGLAERRELTSGLRVLLMHMLKTKYQPERESRSWQVTIRVQRKHLGKFLRQVRAYVRNCLNCSPTPTITRASKLRTKPTSTCFPKRASGESRKCLRKKRVDPQDVCYPTRSVLIHFGRRGSVCGPSRLYQSKL